MARTSATVTESVTQAKKELTKFLKTLDNVPQKILVEESHKIYAEAVAETPYDTGKLRKSVKVTVSRSKKNPTINASASAKSPKGYDYAGIQHENEEFHHNVGKAHYISDPFRRGTLRIIRRLDKEVRL